MRKLNPFCYISLMALQKKAGMREKEPGDGGKSNVQSVASAARLLLPTFHCTIRTRETHQSFQIHCARK